MVVMLHGTAFAQGVTPSADASRFDDYMERERHKPTLPDRVPPISRATAEADITPQDQQVRFYLRDISFKGMSVYNADKVAAPLIGKETTLAELKQFVAELTARYRNDGYILSRANLPPQEIKDGVVQIDIIEGRIAEVDVRGFDEIDQRTLGLARRMLGKLADGRVLRTKDLERAMLLLGDLPGISAQSALSPSENYQDASLLTIVLEENTFEAQLSVDNYGSRYLGRVQMMASGALNGLKNWRERITYQYAYAPSENMRYEMYYASVGWQIPVTSSGLTFGTEFATAHTVPGFRLEEFDVEGKSTTNNVFVSYPFVRTREFSLTSYTAFQSKRVQHQNNIDFGRSDRMYTAKLGSRVELLDGLMGGGFNFSEFSLSKGLVFGGASRNGDLFMSRPDADVEATTFNIDAERHQLLDERNSLVLGVSGQWSSGALLSSREFGVGGSYIGRGYDPSEIVGDHGIAMRVELRHRPDFLQSSLFNGHMFWFVDGGVVWNDDATTPSQAKQTLTSGGVGMRTNFVHGFDADFTAAFPLNREAESEGDKDARLLFSVRKRF